MYVCLRTSRTTGELVTTLLTIRNRSQSMHDPAFRNEVQAASADQWVAEEYSCAIDNNI